MPGNLLFTFSTSQTLISLQRSQRLLQATLTPQQPWAHTSQPPYQTTRSSPPPPSQTDAGYRPPAAPWSLSAGFSQTRTQYQGARQTRRQAREGKRSQNSLHERRGVFARQRGQHDPVGEHIGIARVQLERAVERGLRLVEAAEVQLGHGLGEDGEGGVGSGGLGELFEDVEGVLVVFGAL